MDMIKVLQWLAAIFLGGAIFFFFASFSDLRRRPRLRYVDTGVRLKRTKLSSVKALQPILRLMRPLLRMPYVQRLQLQAEALKIDLDIEAIILVKVVLAVVVGIAISFALSSLPYGALAAVIGFVIPDFFITAKIKGKKEEIARVFPETVDLMDLCIGAGLDFPSSIKWVIDKSNNNAFLEQLSIVLSEIQIGRNRTDALKDLARRLQLPDISSFVRTVVQAERMGTSVEEGFRNLSEDTRNNRFQEGERFAIKASLKILFPLLFCILPVILIVVAGPIIIKFTQGELIPKTF